MLKDKQIEVFKNRHRKRIHVNHIRAIPVIVKGNGNR